MTTSHRQPEHRVDPTSVATAEMRTMSKADLMEIHQQVLEEARTGRSAVEFLKRCHAILVSRTGASLVGLVDLGRSPETRPPIITGITIAEQDLPTIVCERMVSLARDCCQKQCLDIRSGLWGADNLLVAMPTSHEGDCVEALLALGDGRCHWLHVAAIMQVFVAHFSRFRPQTNALKHERLAMEACRISELIQKITECDSANQAAEVFAANAANLMPCQMAVVGLWGSATSGCELSATAGPAAGSLRPEQRDKLLHLLDETVHRDSIIIFPPREGSPFASFMFRDYCQQERCDWLTSGPLKTAQGEVVGAWLVLGGDPPEASEDCARFMSAASATVAAAIQLQRRAQGGFAQKFVRRLQSRISRSNRLSWGVLLATCLLAPFIPIPHTVYGTCELQPVVRRFVAAPFDGTLEESFVDAGDAVQANQVLAKLDERDLKLELQEIESALYRAGKTYDAHVAAKSLGEAAVARLEMEQLRIQIQILTNRMGRIEIRSPLDGLVIAGDVKDAEGVQVTSGQTLFEVAPLEEMVVELNIAEADLPHVSVDLPVTIHLEGAEQRVFRGRIARIRPRSELRDDEYVFIAEVLLENSELQLRPGMHGRCQIDSGHCLLGWRVLHRPWQELVYWAGW